MYNKHPSIAQEKEWLTRVVAHGCVILSPRFGAPAVHGIQIHHVGGRELKQNKLYIGRWFVLPLAWRYHDVYSDDPLNVTKNKNAFIAEHGKETELFKEMCEKLVEEGPLPFDDDVMKAIMDTNR